VTAAESCGLFADAKPGVPRRALPPEPTVETTETLTLTCSFRVGVGTHVVDVVDQRPDGRSWLVGSLAKSAETPGSYQWEIPLAALRIEGRHEFFLELDGTRLPNAIAVHAQSPPKAPRLRARRRSGRYLGRGRV
jgi:hypothetical protein